MAHYARSSCWVKSDDVSTAFRVCPSNALSHSQELEIIFRPRLILSSSEPNKTTTDLPRHVFGGLIEVKSVPFTCKPCISSAKLKPPSMFDISRKYSFNGNVYIDRRELLVDYDYSWDRVTPPRPSDHTYRRQLLVKYVLINSWHEPVAVKGEETGLQLLFEDSQGSLFVFISSRRSEMSPWNDCEPV